MAYFLIENGIIVQKQPNQQDGFVEGPDDVICGWLYDGQNFTAPPPAADPDPPMPTPSLYAAAQLQIVGGDITGIGINSRFAAAFWADVGKYYVFFLEPLPDTSYMVMATAGPCNAYVLEEDKATDFFVITVTNAAGEPTDASSVNISIVRAI